MNPNIKIATKTEFYKGSIFFKMTINNDSSSIIADVTLDFTFDENLLHIVKHDDVPVKKEKFVLGNIYSGNSMSFTILFEPLTCFKATDIRCQVTYANHKGSMTSIFMEPKEISVVCPIMKPDQDINISRLKKLIEELPSKGNRVYEVQNSFDMKNFTSIVREIVTKLDVRHVQTLHTRDCKKYEFWYYGKTKVTNDDIVFKVSIITKYQTLELFAATPDAKSLTGLLAEVGSNLKKIVEARFGSRVLNLHSKDSAIQYSNLLDMCDMEGNCDVNVVIQDSVVQGNNIVTKDEETQLMKKQVEQERLSASEEELYQHKDWKRKGDYFFEKGFYEAAIDCYDKALEINPADCNLWDSKGYVLLKLDRDREADMCFDKSLCIKLKEEGRKYFDKAFGIKLNEEAIEYCDKELELNPNDAGLWKKKGAILRQLSRYKEAIECYTKSLELKPGDAVVYNDKGDVFYYLGYYTEAIECYEKALKLKPDDENLWENKGIALDKLGRYEEAIECYEKVLDRSPDYGVLWEQQGNAFYNLGRYDEAIECFEKALQVSPNDDVVWNNKGDALVKIGWYEEALESYKNALDLNPDNYVVWNKKGNALEKVERHEKAIDCYDKALDIDPNDATLWFNKGFCLDKLGCYNEAINCYDKTLDLNPNNVLGWSYKGAILDKLEHYEEAIKCYEKALALKPNNYYLLLGRKGFSLNELGKHKEAIECYDMSLEINQGDAGIWYNKGDALREMGRYKEAIECFEKSLAITPYDADLWYHKGDAYYNIGLYEEAIECFEKALDLNPNNDVVLSNKGVILDKLGRYEEAIDCYNKALDLKSDDAGLWYHKGNALHGLGRYKEAIECFDMSLDRSPNNCVCSLWCHKGVSLWELGSYRESTECFTKSLEINPDDAVGWYSIGAIFEKLGRYEESLEFYDKAIELKPDCALFQDKRSHALEELAKKNNNLKVKCNKDCVYNSDIFIEDSVVRRTNVNAVEVENGKKIKNSIGMEFVLIPAGEFNMGSNENNWVKPVHKVQISKPFYLGMYPVTQREWKALMGTNPSHFKGNDRPVECVSWDDVQNFIKTLNLKEGTNKYRLPSEAEWEYACRAGTTTKYSFGDDESKLSDYAWYANYAWYADHSGDKTHYDSERDHFEDLICHLSSIDELDKTYPVGQKKPNPWGLYDMNGNVSEWTQDKWHDSYVGAPADGIAWEHGNSLCRVERGGRWNQIAGGCNSASRTFNSQDFGICIDLGFRLLREV